MPFVRRKRTYYKDGVEVPESSITDFGNYKYYKNIVTTKYWKEITTEGEPELAYAAFHDTSYGAWEYAKIPIGSDMTKYWVSNNVEKATDVSELLDSGDDWKSLTEDKAVYSFNVGIGPVTITYTRSYADDLYKDTTVTETVEGTPEDYTYTTEEITPVEVTADDDYDYTEFVPSTEYDYHVDNNKLYQLATVNRSYWKYDYQDFVQPKLTANGTLGGKSFAVAVDSNYDIFYGYKALDGDTSTSWQSMGTTTTGTYFIIYNPLPLNVTKITWSGTPKYGTITEGVVYGSNDNKEYTELATFTGTTTGGTMDLSANDKPYKYYKITPTQWTDKTNTHTNGWAELSITAKEQIIVEGTSEDYDYYVDDNSSHSFIRIKPVYYKYLYEDWTQPVLTSNATDVNGGTIIVSSSSAYSGWGAYEIMNGNTSSGWATAQGVYSGWLKIVFPYKLKISNINLSGRGTRTVEIYDREGGNLIVQGGSENKNTPTDYPVADVVTNTLYFKVTGEETCGINEITLTAQKQNVGEGSANDYDIIVNKHVFY